MGFGGATSAMIASLKHNKRTRKTSFDKLEKYQKENKSKLHFDKKASEKDLEIIRNRLKKKNANTLLKSIVIFLILFSIIFSLFNTI